MTTGRMSVPRWSWSARVIAEPIRNRPLPHPRSSTTGAERPKSSFQSSRPSTGIAFRAVRVHFDGSRTRPGNGTPNSRSVRFGCGFGWGMVFRVVGLGFRQNPRPTLQYTVAVRLCEIRLKGDRVPVLDSLDRREQIPELMDDPGIDPAEHRAALAALARINRL